MNNNKNFSTHQQNMPTIPDEPSSVWESLINDFSSSDYKTLLEKIDVDQDTGRVSVEPLMRLIMICMVSITRELYPNTENLFEQILTDMKQREQFGKEKYNTVLTANNGRNHLVDAYQEALDLLVYLEAHKIQTNDGNYTPSFSGPWGAI